MKTTFIGLSIVLASLSLNAFAAEKCRTSVEEQLAGYRMLPNKAVLLNPGHDDMYMMGEIWNDTKEPLEFYGASRSNGYYEEYFAYGVSLKNCKILKRISIGDSLN